VRQVRRRRADQVTQKPLEISGLGQDRIVPPRGFQHPACLTLAEAVYRVLDRLYDGIPLPSTLQPNKTPKQSERNAEIRIRYAAGESLLDLANEYGLSKQRIHQVATASETIE